MSTLNSSDVDKYIDYNHRYSTITANLDEKADCLHNILKVDEGNVDALRDMVAVNWAQRPDCPETVTHFVEEIEQLLKYTADGDAEVEYFMDFFQDDIITEMTAEAMKQLIRYYSKEISDLKEQLIRFSYLMIENGLFQQVEYFLNLILSFDPSNAEVYWAICLMKIQAKSEQDILNCTRLLQDVPEFNKYLVLVGKKRRSSCIALSAQQIIALKKRRATEIEEEIYHLNNERIILKTERNLREVHGVGCFGLMSLFLGIAFIAMSDMDEAVLTMGIILICCALLFLICALSRLIILPSRTTIERNIEMKAKITRQIADLSRELDDLKKDL